MAESIEAAFEAALSWANYAGDFLSEGGEAVLRGLALAVLEDEHSGCTVRRCNCLAWDEGRCRDYKDSRARIEALS